jgi:hypothetical protein
MSVAVSSTSHFHSSTTLSPADGSWIGSRRIFFTITSHLNSLEVGSMLGNQQPCTPTPHSNQLSTQATVGASTLSRSATPRDPGLSCTLSVWHQGLPHALSVLSVLSLMVAASTCLTRSLSAIAATSLPASTATALPATGDAVTDGIFTGKITNASSEAMMPTVCRIITTAQYYNVSDGAVSSDSSNCANIVPRVGLVLVSMNSLIK